MVQLRGLILYLLCFIVLRLAVRPNMKVETLCPYKAFLPHGKQESESKPERHEARPTKNMASMTYFFQTGPSYLQK